jgi:DNA recombination protein RmuC
MPEIVLVFIGVVVGGVVVWFFSAARIRARLAAQEGIAEELRRQLESTRREAEKLQTEVRAASAEKAAAEERAKGAQQSLEEQRALLDEAKAKLTDAFRSLAAEALKSSNQDFLTLAEERFKALQQEASGELETRKVAIDTLIQPLQKALEDYQEEARELEEKRLREISSVGQQLGEVTQAQLALQRETANLVNALRAPQVRGRWGEIALRKTAELAGMTNYCDFVEQESVAVEGGRLRPDMIVRLPAKREIVVDAKVALNAYLDAVEAPTPETREAALIRHAQQVRSHVRRLASKEYWNQFPQAPEFVVLFIPGEAFFAAAAERDPDLLQDALANHVLISTPTTFIGLLLTAAYGWRQEQIAENAQRISDLGRQVHDRLAILVEYFAKVGKALENSVEAYNKAVGSLETRVLPAARRFNELGAGGAKEIADLGPIDQAPRALAAPEETTPEA